MALMPLPPRLCTRYSSMSRALAVAVLGDGEHLLRPPRRARHVDHLVALAPARWRLHAHGAAADGADARFRGSGWPCPARLPMQQLVAAVGQAARRSARRPRAGRWRSGPLLRRLANSSSAVRLIRPPARGHDQVLALAAAAGMGIMAVTFSPPSSCSRLTIAVPRAVRPASGIS